MSTCLDRGALSSFPSICMGYLEIKQMESNCFINLQQYETRWIELLTLEKHAEEGYLTSCCQKVGMSEVPPTSTGRPWSMASLGMLIHCIFDGWKSNYMGDKIWRVDFGKIRMNCFLLLLSLFEEKIILEFMGFLSLFAIVHNEDKNRSCLLV